MAGLTLTGMTLAGLTLTGMALAGMGSEAAAAQDAAAGQRAAAAPRVAASIPPLQGLAAAVMAGIATPQLLLPAATSPHHAQLRPSAARALAEADLILWVGEGLETGLAGALASQAGDGRVLTLIALPGLTRLPRRLHGLWPDDSPDAPRPDAHRHDGAIADPDPHIWLAPANAAVMVAAIAARLAAIDPARGDRYRAHGDAFIGRLAATDRAIARLLAPVHDRPLVVFHDAFQYFADHYRLTVIGAVMPRPHQAPGARHLSALRRLIDRTGAACLLVEPQFTAERAVRLLARPSLGLAKVDPLGGSAQTGEDFLTMLHGNGRAIADCLAGP